VTKSSPATGGSVRAAMQVIGRRPFAWCAAVLAAALSLSALLLAAAGAQVLRPWIDQGGLPVHATVMLAAGVADSDALRKSMARLPVVASVSFVSRDAALARLAARSAADRDAIAQLAVNPLPDSYVVEFRADVEAADIESAATAMRKMPRVDGVQLDLGWYRKLRSTLRLAAGGALALAALVAINAFGWLLAVIALCARIDERQVRLLNLLGADQRTLRKPAVVAGALSAFVAAAAAIALARLAWTWLEPRTADLAVQYAQPLRVPWPDPQWLVLGTLVLGLSGAVLASIAAGARLGAIFKAAGSH
jgi:cell division protein FtsX